MLMVSALAPISEQVVFTLTQISYTGISSIMDITD